MSGVTVEQDDKFFFLGPEKIFTLFLLKIFDRVSSGERPQEEEFIILLNGHPYQFS